MITEVGAGSQRATKDSTGVTSNTLAYPGNVTSGNFLICAGCAFDSTSVSAINVTSTKTSGIWSVVSFQVSVTDMNWIAYAVATGSGACIVTVDPNDASGAPDFSFEIDEFSTPNTILFSVDGGHSSGTSTTPSDSITTATDNELLIGVMSYGSPDTTISAGANYTLIGKQESTITQPSATVFRIAGAAGAYTNQFSLAASRLWDVQTASFKEMIGPFSIGEDDGDSFQIRQAP